MNLKKLAKQAIEVEKQAISAGFTKKDAADLAAEYLREQMLAHKGGETPATNKEEKGEVQPTFVSPTKLGDSLYERGHTKVRLAGRDVNKLLAQHGLQSRKAEGRWTATKEGESLAKISYVITQINGKTYQTPSKLRWDVNATVDWLMSV